MNIKPFKAYRFNPDVVGDVGACIAPPYDVIDEAGQQSLYQRNDHNMVRIIRGETFATDTPQNNQYTRAAECLNAWISKQALRQDPQERIYGYVQNFSLGTASFERFSFIALAQLEDFGPVVKPHEQILTKPMEDRLNLKRATGARFGLVFMLYEDPLNVAEQIIKKVMKVEALIDFTDDQGVRHRLFGIDQEADQNKIVKMMSSRSCIIADGHHRYTTGLALRRENPAAQYQMIAFANGHQEGLLILATHRVIHGLTSFNGPALIEGLKQHFTIDRYTFNDDESKGEAKEAMLSQMRAMFEHHQSATGIYWGGQAFYVATLTQPKAMDEMVPNMSPAWRALDVAILHKLILEKQLGINEDKLAGGELVSYIKDTPMAIDDCIAQVDAGRQQAAFFTNPVTIAQLVAVTDAGERMPQKSTFFYPKMFTGLTIQKL